MTTKEPKNDCELLSFFDELDTDDSGDLDRSEIYKLLGSVQTTRFCIQKYEFCIENDEFRIKNAGFCVKIRSGGSRPRYSLKN